MKTLSKIKKVDWMQILLIGFIALMALTALTVGGLTVYCWVAYGGKPVTEVPSWALWFMFGGGK